MCTLNITADLTLDSIEITTDIKPCVSNLLETIRRLLSDEPALFLLNAWEHILPCLIGGSSVSLVVGGT